MKLLDGKKIAGKIKKELTAEIELLKKKKIIPGLAVILIGNNPASRIYVQNKEKACAELGIYSNVYRLKSDISQEDLLNIIKKLNKDKKIHGILVQLPLPDQIDERIILDAVDVKKDVDGFHAANVGKMTIGNPVIIPCTPAGVMEMFSYYKIKVEGKDTVVIGKSNIVGKPMAILLINSGATVSVCHSKTKNLALYCKKADIIITATGKANLIKKDMVKKGVIIIDVGINRLSDGKLVGDVDFSEVSKKASAITPVPGGVGPMTIAMLLKNTVKSAKNNFKI